MQHVSFQAVEIGSLVFEDEPTHSAVSAAMRVIQHTGLSAKPMIFQSEGGGTLTVVTLADQIRAWQKLGNSHIDAEIVTGTPSSMVIARLVPILARPELAVLEFSLMLKQLKGAYNVEHPDVAHGGTHQPHEGMKKVEPFTVFIANVMRRRRRTVEMMIDASNDLSQPAINRILELLEVERQQVSDQITGVHTKVNTFAFKLANNRTELKRLSKYAPDDQVKDVERYVSARNKEDGSGETEPYFSIDDAHKHRVAIEKGKAKPVVHPEAKILEGDFWNYINDEAAIPSGSVQALIVDPYWMKDTWTIDGEEGAVMHRIAKLAKRVLKPEGFVVVMLAPMYMFAAHAYLVEGGELKDYWVGCYLQKRTGTAVHSLKMQSWWKPLLIFQLADAKENGSRAKYSKDRFEAEADPANMDPNDNPDEVMFWGDGTYDKGLHPYQQDEKAFEKIVVRFSEEGDTILDCCAGSFTTVVAAVNKRRKAIGIEINPQHIDAAKARVAEAVERVRQEIEDEDNQEKGEVAESLAKEFASFEEWTAKKNDPDYTADGWQQASM